jgi:hypothetical protein
VSFRDEIVDYPGDAVISMEYLGPIGAPRISALARELASELRVIITVRDLGRTVPAMWQETLKNRATSTWTGYLEAIREGGTEPGPGRRFWRQQDAGRIVMRWSRVLGPEHVAVVTLPPTGYPAELLWTRFQAAAGIGDGIWGDGPRANESLGVASALLMRRLNMATADLDFLAYKHRVKALAKHVMPRHRAEEEPIGFKVPRWLRGRAELLHAQLAESGIPVDVAGAEPGKVDAAAELDAAVHALVGALRQVPKITR